MAWNHSWSEIEQDNRIRSIVNAFNASFEYEEQVLQPIVDACRYFEAKNARPVFGEKTLLEAVDGSICWAFKVFHAAVEGGDIDLVKFLLDRGAETVLVPPKEISHLYEESTIEAASRSGNLDIVRLLIDYGADVHQRSPSGKSLLHAAASVGNVDMIEFFIGAKVDPKIKNRHGFTALHLACGNGKLAAVQYLLGAGADENAMSEAGTPLHSAAGSDHADANEVVMLLLKLNVDPNIVNKIGETPLHNAAKRGTAATVKLLCEQTININLTDEDGRTALHIAAMWRNLDAARELLAHGADTEPRDYTRGRTALHLACCDSMLSWSDGRPIAQLLLQQNADITALDEFGNSTLGLAVENDNRGKDADQADAEDENNKSHDDAGDDVNEDRSGRDSAANVLDGQEQDAINGSMSTNAMPLVFKNASDLCVYYGADIFHACYRESKNRCAPCIFRRSKRTARKWIQMYNTWLLTHQWETADVTRVESALMALRAPSVASINFKIDSVIQMTVLRPNHPSNAKAWPIFLKWSHRILVNKHRELLDVLYDSFKV